MNIKCEFFLFLFFSCVFVPIQIGAQELITPKEKKVIIKKVIKRLKKKGFVFNQTFQDVEGRIRANQKHLDTCKTVNEFASTLNNVFNTYDVSHFWIWTPEDVKIRTKSLDVSIGATLTNTEQGFFVSRVTKNGVADKAKILPGDYILKRNGSQIISSSMLNGQPDEIAKIDLRRGEELISKTVKYFSHQLFSKDTLFFINEYTGVIKVNTFRSNVYDRRRIEYLFSAARNTKRIIIDLRSNGGGNSENVQHLLNMIIPTGKICQYYVHREDHNKFLKKHKRKPKSLKELTDFAGRKFESYGKSKDYEVYEGEIIVLIDERSGSGSDTFPTCIQDTNRGVVIGNTSAGKVLAGQSYKLKKGMILFYPDGEFIRLNGIRLEGNGCTPDVQFSRDLTANDSYIFEFIKSFKM